MSAASPAFGTPPGRLTALVVGVWAAVLIGGTVGGAALLRGDPAAPVFIAAPAEPVGGAFTLGDRVPMSFGTASVGSVVRLGGPRRSLGLRVGPGERAFQASLTLINLQQRPVTFAPSAIALDPRARVGDLQVATGAAERGRLEARSPQRYAIRFSVPATADLPHLRLTDPAGGRTQIVRLGTTEGLRTLDLGAHHPEAGGRGR